MKQICKKNENILKISVISSHYMIANKALKWYNKQAIIAYKTINYWGRKIWLVAQIEIIRVVVQGKN